MVKMNRKLEYSLIALKHMSQKQLGTLTTVKEVSELYGIPFDATARVMQLMTQKGWLKSEQGAFGGYKVMRDLSKLTFLDLIDTIEGSAHIARCLHVNNPCDLWVKCNITSSIKALNQRLNNFYQRISLQEILLGDSDE